MQSALVPALVVALHASPLDAQVAQSAGLSPSPVLPPSGQPSLEGQFVYLGPTVHELTVFYPLRGPDGKLAGYGKVIRIPLGNGVSPQVSVTLRRNPDGTFLYSYSVANLSGARQALAQWSLPVPAGVGTVGAPPGWQVTADGPIDSDYRPQGPEQMSPLRRTVILTWSTERALAPGEVREGFTIRSSFAPGALIQAFATAGELQIPGDLPEEVRKQLEPWQRPEWRARAAWVIGPRYPANFPRNLVAHEFSTALNVRLSERELDANSRFVQEAAAQLQAMAVAEQLPGAASGDLRFLSLAASAKEKELAEAIRLALFAP
ncbi:MAG TPA: hypothetical protein VNJ11_07460 [Bryobacteraceae bacterium]|nr:hypothetical protein [Bryobacteraceae bacterium]